MRFTLHGHTYTIRFEYAPRFIPNGDGTAHREVGAPPTFTDCYIEHQENGQYVTVASGTAQRVAQDQFKRETGRKLALARALSDFVPYGTGSFASADREERRVVWEAYLNRKNGTRETVAV